jgi:toxin-antitoxin system PIN domain toxin
MIIPDLNLLLYAYNPGALNHRTAKEWWEQLLGSGERVGIPWAVILGFIRLSTTRGVFATPAMPDEAVDRVESWLEQSNVSILSPGARHLSELRGMLGVIAGGALTTDAHLAALAIENQAELHSNDLDFSRFPGLRWHNPLASKSRRAPI